MQPASCGCEARSAGDGGNSDMKDHMVNTNGKGKPVLPVVPAYVRGESLLRFHRKALPPKSRLTVQLCRIRSDKSSRNATHTQQNTSSAKSKEHHITTSPSGSLTKGDSDHALTTGCSSTRNRWPVRRTRRGLQYSMANLASRQLFPEK